MTEIIYILIGIIVGAVSVFLFRSLLRSEAIDAEDSDVVREALSIAAELIAKRAMERENSNEKIDRIEDKLKIEDPRDRIREIAKELEKL